MKWTSDNQKRRTYPPKLRAEDVPTALSVLTIKDARGVDTVAKPFVAVIFEEYPDKEWTTNAGQTKILGECVKAGVLPDPDKDTWLSWAGRKLVMCKVENHNPETGEVVVKLYPVEAGQQAEMLETLLIRDEKKKAAKAK